VSAPHRARVPRAISQQRDTSSVSRDSKATNSLPGWDDRPDSLFRGRTLTRRLGWSFHSTSTGSILSLQPNRQESVQSRPMSRFIKWRQVPIACRILWDLALRNSTHAFRIPATILLNAGFLTKVCMSSDGAASTKAAQVKFAMVQASNSNARSRLGRGRSKSDMGTECSDTPCFG